VLAALHDGLKESSPKGHEETDFEIADFIVELVAIFAAEQVILPANGRFCLFQYRVRPREKCCLTTKGTIRVFAPLVAIPGKRSAAEFCKGLGFSF